MKYINIFLCLLSFMTIQAQGVFTNYTTDDGLANNVVNCVKVDSKDNLYFGTNAGLSIFDQNDNWKTITTADGLIDNVIKAIHVTDEGIMCIGTDLGISIGDGTTFKNYTTADGIGNNRIEAITEDGIGQFYFATKGGFAILDKDKNWSSYGTAEGLPFGGVKDIEVQASNLIWLATGLSGVILYNTLDNSIVTIGEGSGILSNATTGIALGESSAWISSGGGVDKFDNIPGIIEFEEYPSVFELPPPHTLNQVVDIQLNSEGIVWAGIYIDYLVNVGGISFYDGQAWNSLDVSDGLVGPVVNQIAIDSQDAVWVATSTGVSKYAITSTTQDITDLLELSLYPNPTAQTISLTLAQPAAIPLPLVLYTSALQQIEQQTLAQGYSEASFDLATYPSGVYYVRIGENIKKVVKL